MTGVRVQVVFTAVLLSAVAVVALHGVRAFRDAERQARARDGTTHQIATDVAGALDGGTVAHVRVTAESLLSSHPEVRAIEVIPQDPGMLNMGAAARRGESESDAPSEAREIALVRGGRTWGTVRITYDAAAPAFFLNLESPVSWAIAAGAVLVLPVLVALLEGLRRRFDRSPSGPMAVAAERARDTLDTLAEGVLLLDARA